MTILSEVITLVYLRDQDVILVEAYNNKFISSGLKNNALYEMNEDETIQDVLNFAGGFSSNFLKINYS